MYITNGNDSSKKTWGTPKSSGLQKDWLIPEQATWEEKVAY